MGGKAAEGLNWTKQLSGAVCNSALLFCVFLPPDIQSPQVVAWLDWLGLFIEMLLSVLEINSLSLPIPVTGCKSQPPPYVHLSKYYQRECCSQQIDLSLNGERVGFGDWFPTSGCSSFICNLSTLLLMEGMKRCPPKSRDEHSCWRERNKSILPYWKDGDSIIIIIMIISIFYISK